MTGKFSDLSIPAFKDKVFVKNLIFTLFKGSSGRFKFSKVLGLTYILFMMEQLGNYSLVNQEIINFEKRFK